MRLYKFMLVLALLLGAAVSNAYAQIDKKEVRQGNREFAKENWKEADISYRKALVKDSTSFAANYNLADNLYRQKDYQGAAKYMDAAMNLGEGHSKLGDAAFNRGDIAIAAKDWQKAVEVLKQAMLSNPDDLQAKENYAYAKKMLENQQQNQQQDQQQNQQNQDQDNQDQDNQDQNQDQDNQDQNQDSQQDQNNNGQQKPQPQGISQQQAQQILKAVQAKEKETQDKVNKEKAAQMQNKQKEKNW